ncbi:MAG: helix-turn-helix domain-containing protein [Actinomycetota bacterium]
MATAAELFSTKGFAETSMADLAEQLGISKAAIYHHFESKESIFQTLLKSSTMILKN